MFGSSLLAELLRAASIKRVRGRDTAAAGAAGAHLPDVVAGAVVRAGPAIGPGNALPAAPRTAGAEAGALGHERGVRGGPTVVEPADDVVVAHARVVDEHFVEQRAARHLPQRADLDAGLLHVELEVA